LQFFIYLLGFIPTQSQFAVISSKQNKVTTIRRNSSGRVVIALGTHGFAALPHFVYHSRRRNQMRLFAAASCPIRCFSVGLLLADVTSALDEVERSKYISNAHLKFDKRALLLG
jgi:hypothetical protein